MHHVLHIASARSPLAYTLVGFLPPLPDTGYPLGGGLPVESAQFNEKRVL